MACAKPYQLVSPEQLMWNRPLSQSEFSISKSEKAICVAEVGAPRWSSTTRSSSRSAARRRMVFRKFFPFAA
ncbi:hypothetical protein D3C83_60320 [compost metagenome]